MNGIRIGMLIAVLMGSNLNKDMRSTFFPRVEIPSTELRFLSSVATGQAYDLYVHLPKSYRETNDRYPVIYLFDGQWDFPLVTGISISQYLDGCIPETIVVGIAWHNCGGDCQMHRNRDFLPTVSPDTPNSGGAPLFVEFLKDELIPFIESSYRIIRNDRVLMGSSAGASFGVYAIFREPELFNGAVFTSPAFTYDDGIIFEFEQKFAAEHHDLPVRMFLAAGGAGADITIGLAGAMEDMVAVLKTREYPNLDLRSMIIEGVGHSGSKAEGFTRGLQYVFSDSTESESLGGMCEENTWSE